MLDFLRSLYEFSAIQSTDARTVVAAPPVSEPSSRVNEVERRIDALILTNMAMWSILSEKLGVADKELLDRMTEIDLSDGKLDGKVSDKPGVSTCASCGRTLSKRHARCFYCATPNPNAKPFGKAAG